jgi:hypothetical protein
MAKRNSMSKARLSRNRKQRPVTQSNTTATRLTGNESGKKSLRQTAPVDLAKIIREERIRLMKAQAVLGCVTFALLYEDWLEGLSRPCFADALTAVQDLVDRAVSGLPADLR